MCPEQRDKAGGNSIQVISSQMVDVQVHLPPDGGVDLWPGQPAAPTVSQLAADAL